MDARGTLEKGNGGKKLTGLRSVRDMFAWKSTDKNNDLPIASVGRAPSPTNVNLHNTHLGRGTGQIPCLLEG